MACNSHRLSILLTGTDAQLVFAIQQVLCVWDAIRFDEILMRNDRVWFVDGSWRSLASSSSINCLCARVNCVTQFAVIIAITSIPNDPRLSRLSRNAKPDETNICNTIQSNKTRCPFHYKYDADLLIFYVCVLSLIHIWRCRRWP